MSDVEQKKIKAFIKYNHEGVCNVLLIESKTSKKEFIELCKVIPKEKDFKIFDNLLKVKEYMLKLIDHSNFTPDFKKNFKEVIEALYDYIDNNSNQSFLKDLINDLINDVIRDENIVEPEIVKTYFNPTAPPIEFMETPNTTADTKPQVKKKITDESIGDKSFIAKILFVVLLIIGTFIFISWLFGFIYAYRAEKFHFIKTGEWRWSRVILRTFCGFAYVAIYWSNYGFW